MNSQITEAFPERNSLTISTFLSLSLLSLSLKILRSACFSSSVFLSLERICRLLSSVSFRTRLFEGSLCAS
jgi:hypothetical protein